MTFFIGSELSEQIYKEGEPTWGCKLGVLDVEDVQIFIAKVKELKGIKKHKTIIQDIERLAGKKLIKNYSFEVKGE